MRVSANSKSSSNNEGDVGSTKVLKKKSRIKPVLADDRSSEEVAQVDTKVKWIKATYEQ